MFVAKLEGPNLHYIMQIIPSYCISCLNLYRYLCLEAKNFQNRTFVLLLYIRILAQDIMKTGAPVEEVGAGTSQTVELVFLLYRYISANLFIYGNKCRVLRANILLIVIFNACSLYVQ